MNTAFANNLSPEEIATKGTAVYESIKKDYEPGRNGMFLAIEPESEKAYLGNTVTESIEKAREENPGKLFFIVKIGFSTVETMAQALLSRT